ncbi:MAG TPA: NRDE family protein [Azoarcus taiwanensis]|uniref:NRDE family protein n=1 Tax=Azoarcus taiwanensis TaxID=666964 RepID=A0A972J7R3_9RHOO|nr:NRDE family protein [Azoarcus taiwanensis]NMG02076.1 hypothetical protein [Azoarcus taiwanensis]HRQ57985.1 NRDE family protein [Azoarcus taiwanensis]
MCLIVLAWQVHPDYRLVVAANRDEFRERPASPAHWWTDAPHILAGRDLEAGGTWMGLTRQGRFAALTNYRDPSGHRPGAPSRGTLVRDCLSGSADTESTLNALAGVSGQYVGFNLFVSDGRTLGIHESTTGAVRRLEPGIYGLSNHVLNTDWPKLRRARSQFAEALKTLPEPEPMLRLLRDTTPAADHELPSTGVSLEWERLLSPVFVSTADYGTRCSSLITIGHDGNTRFSEWTWNAEGEVESQVEHRFTRRS